MPVLTPETIKHPSELRALSLDELRDFAALVREFLLENVSQTGGHIGANLGTIELTLALHYVYDTPNDVLIFDTGHQGYTHKIVTGRAHIFKTLNQNGGMSRFLSREECPEHDPIEASHAGTSVSIGIGMARAFKLQGLSRRVIVVIGDGSCSEGLAMEAMNDTRGDENLRVIFNVNGYAISPASGIMHDEFEAHDCIDGHDLGILVDALRGCPSDLVVRTKKGNGWEPSDRHPYRAHFLFPFDRHTGAVSKAPDIQVHDRVGQLLLNILEDDPKAVVITPSTIYATGLQPVFDAFPTRCFDPGMSEQHAMTLAAGLSVAGMRVFIAYQSTFAQRAFDQLFHDICGMGLPVTLLLYRSGFAGLDSPTHHGIYDLAWLGALPGLEIHDAPSFSAASFAIRAKATGPRAVLMQYGSDDSCDMLDEWCPRVRIFYAGVGDVPCEVAKYLGGDAVRIHRIQPLQDSLGALLRGCERVVVWEERTPHGGLGERVAAFLLEHQIERPFLRIGLPLTFAPAGDRRHLLGRYGMDQTSTYQKIIARWPELSSQTTK